MTNKRNKMFMKLREYKIPRKLAYKITVMVIR